MSDVPLISVVIPTYNRAHCIADAIDSVLRQDPPPYEVIVVDDGSVDETVGILAQYGDRITCLYQPNAGVSAARNLGIKHASGDWLTFLDSDDLWTEERMSVLVSDLLGIGDANVVAHVADLNFTGSNYSKRLFELRNWTSDECASIHIGDWLQRALSGVSPCSAAVRRDIAIDVGGFPANLAIGEDIYFFAAVSLMGSAIFNDAVVAEARRFEEDHVAVVDLFRRDPIEAYLTRDRLFVLLSDLSLSGQQRDTVNKLRSGNLLRLANAEASTGVGNHRRTLLETIRVHPKFIRPLLRAIPPFLIGRKGYQAVLRQNGFTRVGDR
ncbi:glycosyltransferase family 2 protein [Aestuariivita boseongensis]|uniref:glycosyltransferase family 2 protein n=1 Tax=Aestuariivita boseongensis TaxID=1470562 RepID=UPI0009E24BD4|nr:glycosyltransferase family 2 protein [Aestuariivita boseongensis]